MRQAADSLAAGRAASPDRTGTVIAGRFKLEALIAREGGTEVYQAIDGTTGSPHAVRVVPLGNIVGQPERLLTDVGKTQALRHKNLVDVEATGIDGDVAYVAAELVDGQTLREFIDSKNGKGQGQGQGQGTSLKGACNLVAHVANALDYASRAVRHGALNPAIIWVNRAGRVKVSGLGIGPHVPGFARHGAPQGAPDTLYMAPEIIAGGPPRAASDVFSLGMIFYELLTGQPPGSPYQPPSRVVPDVPVSVDQAVARALSRVPEERWATPTEFKDALQQAGGPLPGATQTMGSGNQRTGAQAPEPAPAPAGSRAPRSTGGAGAPDAAGAAAPGRRGGPAPNGVGGFPQGAPQAPQMPQMQMPGLRPGQPAGRGTPSSPSAGAGPAGGPPPGLSPSPAPPGRATRDGSGLVNLQQPGRATRDGSGLVNLPAAPPSPEDLVEKWLVHKDNLDFGPFSMVQVRAQIERGEILADHLLIDNDTGSKGRVRDVPGLHHMAKQAHRRLEQARRAHAEQRSAKSEKKKSMFMGIVITAVVLVLAAGAAIFLLSRRDTSGGKLASREEEAEIEQFLKGVKIGGMKASVHRAPAGGHRSGGGNLSGGSPDELDNNANFGDVGKGFYQGDQTLDDDQIQSVMMANYRKLIPCIAHAGVSNIALDFAVRGNGKVSAVKVNGQTKGALPGCMLQRMQSFNFPKFNGSKTIASWSMSMGR